MKFIILVITTITLLLNMVNSILKYCPKLIITTLKTKFECERCWSLYFCITYLTNYIYVHHYRRLTVTGKPTEFEYIWQFNWKVCNHFSEYKYSILIFFSFPKLTYLVFIAIGCITLLNLTTLDSFSNFKIIHSVYAVKKREFKIHVIHWYPDIYGLGKVFP